MLTLVYKTEYSNVNKDNSADSIRRKCNVISDFDTIPFFK